MTKAIALARTHIPALSVPAGSLSDAVRAALVTGCGLALVLAGPVLPL